MKKIYMCNVLLVAIFCSCRQKSRLLPAELLITGLPANDYAGSASVNQFIGVDTDTVVYFNPVDGNLYYQQEKKSYEASVDSLMLLIRSNKTGDIVAAGNLILVDNKPGPYTGIPAGSNHATLENVGGYANTNKPLKYEYLPVSTKNTVPQQSSSTTGDGKIARNEESKTSELRLWFPN